jgi:hypothetical protein
MGGGLNLRVFAISLRKDYLFGGYRGVGATQAGRPDGGFSYLDRIIIGMSFNPDNFDNFDEQRYKQEN